MICTTLQLACRQAKRPPVIRETTVCALGYIHSPKLYEIGTNQQLPYNRNHNLVLEVAVLGSHLPQSLLSALELIALWRPTLIVNSKALYTIDLA
jgi:hypothetical protein